MGVECLGETNTCFEEGMEGKKKVVHRGSKAWIVATDSEYVVKGITEWLPTWKVSVVIPMIGGRRLIGCAEEWFSNEQGHEAGQSRSLRSARRDYREV